MVDVRSHIVYVGSQNVFAILLFFLFMFPVSRFGIIVCEEVWIGFQVFGTILGMQYWCMYGERDAATVD